MEIKVARELGGERIPGSGNSPNPDRKGDVCLDEFLVEVKSTQKNSFVLRADVLGKICREARSIGKTPAVVLSFSNTLPFPLENLWIILPLEEFKKNYEKGGCSFLQEYH